MFWRNRIQLHLQFDVISYMTTKNAIRTVYFYMHCSNITMWHPYVLNKTYTACCLSIEVNDAAVHVTVGLFSGTISISSQMTQCRIILLLQPITRFNLFTIELKVRDDFRRFRSKMCFCAFITVPLNNPVASREWPNLVNSRRYLRYTMARHIGYGGTLLCGVENV